MSNHLKAFLTAYLAWVDAGAPKGGVLMRSVGLCGNLEDWLVDRGISWSKAGYEVGRLVDRFHAEGLDKHYPFGGEDIYYKALESGEQHLNDARIQWVRSKVSQFEVV